MKKILLSMVVLLALGGNVEVVAQHHRHTPRVELSDSVKEGIEAYSDTSSVAAENYNADADSAGVDEIDMYSPARFSDPISWLNFMFSSSMFGMVAGIFVLLLLLCIFFSPIIILILILRYMIRRHKDRVRLTEMAMEHGQMLTDEQMPLSCKSPDYMWRRGVRNVSIGIGLMLFFWFLGVRAFVGIGGLVACLGAGQMFMVRYNYDSKFGRKRDEEKQ